MLLWFESFVFILPWKIGQNENIYTQHIIRSKPDVQIRTRCSVSPWVCCHGNSVWILWPLRCFWVFTSINQFYKSTIKTPEDPRESCPPVPDQNKIIMNLFQPADFQGSKIGLFFWSLFLPWTSQKQLQTHLTSLIRFQEEASRSDPVHCTGFLLCVMETGECAGCCLNQVICSNRSLLVQKFKVFISLLRSIGSILILTAKSSETLLPS